MRARSLAVGFFLFALVGAAANAACELLLPTVALDAPDAAVSPDAAAACVRVTAPEKPSVPDGGIGADFGPTDFITAIEKFPDQEHKGPLGLDLDGLCTCPGPEACKPRDPSAPHCDSTGGIDNSGGDFLAVTINGFVGATAAGDLTTRISKGLFTILIEVRGYSGAPNQNKVVVGIYDSHGHYVVPDDGGSAFTAPPSWDGGDEWTIDCTMSAASCIGKASEVVWLGDGGYTPGFIDEVAYVSDGTLVAHIPSVTLDFAVTQATLTSVVLVAKLSPESGSYRLDGQLVGSVTTRDMLSSLSRVHGSSGGFLCGDDPDLSPLKDRICAAADLPPGSDDDAGAPCGALSFAIPFTARPAMVGYRFDRPTPYAQGCDGAIDDCR